MMQSFRRAIALLGLAPWFLSQPSLALTTTLQPSPGPLSQRVTHPNAAPIRDQAYPIAQGSQRMKDCMALQNALAEVSLQFTALQSSLQGQSITDSQARSVINQIINLSHQSANRIRALSLQDSGVKAFQGHFAQMMGDFNTFAGNILDAIERQDPAKAQATAQQFLQGLSQQVALGRQFQEYCQAGAPAPSTPTPSTPAPSTPAPGSSTSGTPSTGDLNAQLQQAVNAKDWTRSIQIVDQMIQQYPNRVEELKQYREQLVKLQNAR